MSRALAVLVVLALGLLAGGCASDGVSTGLTNGPGSTDGVSTGSTTEASDGVSTGSTDGPGSTDGAALPLAGKVVVLDPGHQLGNRHFSSEINEPVDAGGFDKACNTTGTATDAGYPEATFVWQVAKVMRKVLRRLGAIVILTRSSNSDDEWGPCVDERGRIGNPGQPGPTADLRLSIHADGVSTGSANGFHVIRPGVLDGWTDDISKASRRLAHDVRNGLTAAGFPTSTYVGKNGIDVRTDLGTLNHSDVPTVMVELGNMRNPDEAAQMETAEGRRLYAQALAAAVKAYLVN